MSENKYLHGTFIDRIDPELHDYLHGPQTYGPYYPYDRVISYTSTARRSASSFLREEQVAPTDTVSLVTPGI